jgi:hypothetical protein
MISISWSEDDVPHMIRTCGLRVLGPVRRCELECFGHSFETWFVMLFLVKEAVDVSVFELEREVNSVLPYLKTKTETRAIRATHRVEQSSNIAGHTHVIACQRCPRTCLRQPSSP